MMSVGNLRRRRLRTVLTMLGVVIGTASVVVMISLGIGLDRMTTSLYESYGSMTAIEVYSRSGRSDKDMTIDDYLTDKTVAELSRLDHVKTVSPSLRVMAVLKQGNWESNISLTGVDRTFLDEIETGQGRLPAPGELELFFGNQVITSFMNSKTNKGYWETNELPDVDLLGKPVFAVFDTEAYYSSKNPSGDTKVKAPKKYMLQGVGIGPGSLEDWNRSSYYVYTDIDALKEHLSRIFKNKPIPGQPTNKKGKPYREYVYDEITVYCDSMDEVMSVQASIAALGYECNSNMEWLEQSKEQSKMIQLVLGGIGAVSLFVAAIGIANTMMMSIYERTKEIGIMKVLGCDMGNIRNMFLIESGFIGLFGGIIGVVFSYLISLVINKFVGAASLLGLGGGAGSISQIPFMLSVGAVAFATVIGTLAGLFPSLRAMNLSPLNAIRNE